MATAWQAWQATGRPWEPPRAPPRAQGRLRALAQAPTVSGSRADATTLARCAPTCPTTSQDCEQGQVARGPPAVALGAVRADAPAAAQQAQAATGRARPCPSCRGP